ncbi:MAG: acetate kinase, partial [Solirubrobacterales bacterium]
MKILIINAGSSSVKYYLYEMPEARVVANGTVERVGETASRLMHWRDHQYHESPVHTLDVDDAMSVIFDTLVRPDIGVLHDLSEIGAVGHRVVHGGEEFTHSVVVDEQVIASIVRYADLAPLHNPPNLAGIRAAGRRLPGVKQIACFDTAFHMTIPRVAYMYGLPYDLYETYHIRRY